MQPITINITDDQVEALKRLSPDISLEEAAQDVINNATLSTIQSFAKEKGLNIILFLNDNPDVAKQLKSSHNLDDTFAPIKVQPLPADVVKA